MELCIFSSGGYQFGVDIKNIVEIIKQPETTPVLRVPEFVLGVMNLRGKIVTVMDLAIRLGLNPISETRQNRIIVLSYVNEHIGLLVNRVEGVKWVDPTKMEPPPVNISEGLANFIQAVFHYGGELICVLNVDKVLA